tara:strand:- start:6446 stop:7648 length:1203 start_codon:yes stop_codon:yes gene_type:complete
VTRWLIPQLFLLLFAIPVQAQVPTEDVHGYVYVEPFELRKEFAVYLRAYPKWQAAAELGDVIKQEQREAILAEFQEKFDQASPLTMDGSPANLKLDRIQFVRIADELGVIPDDRAEIAVAEAMIAAVYAVPTNGYPEVLELTWDFFPRPDLQVPVVFVTGAGKATLAFSEANQKQQWNVPANAKLPTLLPVPAVVASAETGPTELPIPSLVLMGCALLIGIVGRLAPPRANLPLGIAAVLCLVGAPLLWGFGRVPLEQEISDLPAYEETYVDEVVYALLRNIYHAFDYRDESKIYDTLAASVDGALLEQIYLEIRRGLELEDQGGPRVKVTTVDLRETFAEPIEEREGFRADVEWRAVGEVTHWGHTHKRPNFYHAWLVIEPRGETWKLTELEIVEEGRL